MPAKSRQTINYWWITASERNPKRRWRWQYFFDDPEQGYNWGGPKWIKSRASFARIEDMCKGDIIVAYQAEEGVQGLAYLASDGYQYIEDGNYDTFDLKSRPTIWLDEPIPLRIIRGLPNAKRDFEFLRMLRGTVFRIHPKGFSELLKVVRALNPIQRKAISKFMGRNAA